MSREYLAVLKDAGEKSPLLLVVLGSSPPVLVQGHGHLELADAVMLQLEDLHARTEAIEASLPELVKRVAEAVAWITWDEIRQIVVRQSESFIVLEEGTASTVRRLSGDVTGAIDWHS